MVFFSIPVIWEHICILNARLGGETDQQNVIMHKAYSAENKWTCEKIKLTDFLQICHLNIIVCFGIENGVFCNLSVFSLCQL